MSELARLLASDKRRPPKKKRRGTGPGLGLPPSYRDAFWRMFELTQKAQDKGSGWDKT